MNQTDSVDLQELPKLVELLNSVQTKSGQRVALFHLSEDFRKPVLLSALDIQMLQGVVPFEKMIDAQELAGNILIQAQKEKNNAKVNIIHLFRYFS